MILELNRIQLLETLAAKTKTFICVEELFQNRGGYLLVDPEQLADTIKENTGEGYRLLYKGRLDTDKNILFLEIDPEAV